MQTRSCDVENTQDFHRYYSNSWLGLHLANRDHVVPALLCSAQDNRVTIRSLSPDASMSQGYPYALSGYQEFTWKEIQEKMDFGRPDIGMLPTPGSVSFYAYSTPRAPQKGLRPSELKAYDFNSWNIRKKMGGIRFDQYSAVWNALNPVFKTVPEALKILDEGKSVGQSLSRVFAAFTVPDCGQPLLAYKRWTIGYFDTAGSVRLTNRYGEYAAMVSKSLRTEVQVA